MRHAAARAAKTALEEARETVAEVLGARPDEVVFTGGGTEADNLAVKGGARAARRVDGLDGVVTTAFEHKGVLAAAHRLEREGFRVAEAAVTPAGLVDLDDLAARLDDRTALVSVMGVNNELGTIQPLPEVAAIVRERAPRRDSTPTRCRPCRGSTSRRSPPASTSSRSRVTSSAGPKGVGALVVRSGVRSTPRSRAAGRSAACAPAP